MAVYLGLFLISLSTVMFEILLTRIFSVVTWYYFAFLAVSVAMLGLSVGALAVYIFPQYFTEEKLRQRLSLLALWCGLSIDVGLLIFLSVPFQPRASGVGIFSTILIFVVLAAPFAFSGAAISLVLSRFARRVGLFYAADLLGAALGAFLIIPVLNVMDGPSAVFFAGACAALAALCFAGFSANKEAVSRKLFTKLLVSALILLSLPYVNLFLRVFRVEWVQMRYNVAKVESWNSFSRVAVYPPRLSARPHGWGFSTVYQPKKPLGEMLLEVDGIAEMVMTYYDGTGESIEHLKYDVAFIAHYLRSPAKVFIIGFGAGRDILAARAFGQPEVVGAEINEKIVEMTNQTFGDFSGHLDKLPGVTIISDEARSVLCGKNDEFDIIQATAVATWSSTAAGALILAENSLYTIEAWKIFYEHLSPQGLLSFNRWYLADYPAQLLRLTSLAAEMLKAEGIRKPGEHIVCVRSDRQDGNPFESATLLVSKAPFSNEDLKTLRSVADKLKFKLEFDPGGYQNGLFREAVDNAGKREFYASTPLMISAPSDDRPFFYSMLRFPDLFRKDKLQYTEQRFNYHGLSMLYVILLVSVALSLVLIISPLVFSKNKLPLNSHGISLIFLFAAIGFGYMLVEIAQLQRLVIFLGHPIYSITVVLFAMLLASGLGALASNRWFNAAAPESGKIILVMSGLLAVLSYVTFKQPAILLARADEPVAVRIAIALFFLLPLGFLMGFPFPLSFSLANAKFKEHTPWFWAINGAAGVVASVLSVCLSIAGGITLALMGGSLAYLLAAGLLMSVSRIK